MGTWLLGRLVLVCHVRSHLAQILQFCGCNFRPRYSLSLCLSLLLPDVPLLKKPNSPLLSLFDPISDLGSSSSAPETTVSLSHRCCTLLRCSTALLNTPHSLQTPPQSFPPSTLFDLLFFVLATTPASIKVATLPAHVFPSVVPPLLPSLHIDAIKLFSGTAPTSKAWQCITAAATIGELCSVLNLTRVQLCSVLNLTLVQESSVVSAIYRCRLLPLSRAAAGKQQHCAHYQLLLLFSLNDCNPIHPRCIPVWRVSSDAVSAVQRVRVRRRRVQSYVSRGNSATAVTPH